MISVNKYHLCDWLCERRFIKPSVEAGALNFDCVRSCLFFSVSFFIACNIYSQADSSFWFVAPDLQEQHGDRPVFLHISSLSNDGKNDWFKMLGGYNVKEFHMVVYNRWGQKVFETSNPAQGWNGLFNGQVESSATFVWYCEFKKPGNADKIKMKGAVTLIK